MTIEDVFTFDNLYESGKQCCNGVRWKTGTQNFEKELAYNVNILRKQVLQGNFKSKGFHKFTLKERGKTREIASVNITERAVQKCLCDYYLVPKFSKSFIYDSGACLKGKGVRFSVKRLETHLHKYITKHSNNGYILTFDISNFFGSIDHETLLNIVKNKFDDKRLYDLYAYFITRFEGNKGLGLGSQVSQISANIYLNVLDHYIKDVLRVKFYGRYMDDGYIICESKQELKELLQKIKNKLKELKLELSPKKTHICSLKNFSFLKRRYAVFDNNKISKRPYKKNILRYKRKLKKLIKTNADAVKQIIINFNGYLKEFNYFDRYTRTVEQCIQ